MFSLNVIKLMSSDEALAKAKSYRTPQFSFDSLVQRVARDISRAASLGETRSNVLMELEGSASVEDYGKLIAHLREHGYSVSAGLVSWKKRADD